MQTGEFPVYGSPGCGVFSDGTLLAPSAGLVLIRPRFFPGDIGLHARLSWRMENSRYTSAPLDDQNLYDSSTGTLIRIDREFRYEMTAHSVRADLLGSWSLGSRASLTFGPTLGLRFQAKFDQSDNVVGPEGRSFIDGETRHDMERSFKASESSLSISWTLGIGYEIGRNRPLRLEGFARADLLPIINELGWRAYTAGIGGAFFPFDPPPSAPVPLPDLPPQDTIHLDTIARDTVRPIPAPPTASIDIYGIDDESRASTQAIVTVAEIFFRQYTPFLPVVYFDSGSAAFPERYSRITGRDAMRFNYIDIAELLPLQLSHTALNLIARRMKDDPDTKITLYGSQADNEPDGLGFDRAETVRDYLTSVWRIPARRIETRAGAGSMALSDERTDDGRDENRRVLISSSSPSLLAPLSTERIVREFNPPRVKLSPDYTAEAGIRQWRVTVRQGNLELATFTNQDSSNSATSELAWRLLDDRIDSALGMLVAELDVEDSLGRWAHAADSIALQMHRDSQVVESIRQRRGEVERILYSLTAFDYKSATVAPNHQRQLSTLSRLVRPEARITIVGYTDRIGDERTNVELSNQRAESVAARLRDELPVATRSTVDIATRGAGVDTDRFPNDLPEGRVLSRGVSITIDQKSDTTGKRTPNQ